MFKRILIFKQILLIITSIVILVTIGTATGYVVLKQEKKEKLQHSPVSTSSKQKVTIIENKSNERATSTESHINISEWKTWYWNQKHGNFEIKYPSNWKTSKIYSDKLGCTGYLFYGSLQRNDGIVLTFSYSTSSAVAITTIKKVEEKIKKFPKKSVFFSTLKGTREIIKLSSGTLIAMEFYTKHNTGIYLINVNIMDPFNKGYENQVKQILSTFKIRSKK
jgi:hypothetical protein